MAQACEKCGATGRESQWLGLSYSVRCSKCHWGWVTTRFPPIRADKRIYRIWITSLGMDPKKSLVFLNQRFSHGIEKMREMISSGKHALLVGDACAVWTESKRLMAKEISFRIEPEFPYDLSIGNIETQHEHEWTMITD